MKYYYNIDGQNYGPVTRDELDRLASDGKIHARTLVVAANGKKWERYGSLEADTQAGATSQEVPQEDSSSMKPKEAPTKAAAMSDMIASYGPAILRINPLLSEFLKRLFKLPSFIPLDKEEQLKKMSMLGGITALVVWGSYVIVGLSTMTILPFLYFLGVIVATLVVGFFAQHIAYLLYHMTNTLLVGSRIKLASMGIPRLIGFVSILFAVVSVINLFMADSFGEALLMLCPLPIAVGMVYLCYNADKLFVDIETESVSPARELNNSLRFIVRAFVTVFHVLSPILALVAALSFFISIISLKSGTMGFGAFGMMEVLIASASTVLVYINAPLFTWLILCISSWTLDLMDSLFSLTSIDKNIDKIAKK